MIEKHTQELIEAYESAVTNWKKAHPDGAIPKPNLIRNTENGIRVEFIDADGIPIRHGIYFREFFKELKAAYRGDMDINMGKSTKKKDSNDHYFLS